MGESPLSAPQRRHPVGTERGLNATETQVERLVHVAPLFNLPSTRTGRTKIRVGLWMSRKKKWTKTWNPIFQDTLHPAVYARSSGDVVGMFFSMFVRNSKHRRCHSSMVWVAPLRLDGGMWITAQAQPLLRYPSCLALQEGPLASKSESAGGTFCSWIANRAFCAGVRDAGRLDGSSLAGRGAGPRRCRVEGGHGG